jgi:hypothetical protein
MMNKTQQYILDLLESYNAKLRYMYQNDDENENYYGKTELQLQIATIAYYIEKIENKTIKKDEEFELIYDDNEISRLIKKYNLNYQSFFRYDILENRLINLIDYLHTEALSLKKVFEIFKKKHNVDIITNELEDELIIITDFFYKIINLDRNFHIIENITYWENKTIKEFFLSEISKKVLRSISLYVQNQLKKEAISEFLALIPFDNLFDIDEIYKKLVEDLERQRIENIPF